MTEQQQIGLLLYKHMQGTLSVSEETILDEWKAASAANQALFDELLNEETLSQAIADYHPDRRKEAEDRIFAKISSSIPELKVRPIYRRLFFRVAVAASIILALGLGSYLLFFNNDAKQSEIAKIPELPNDVKAPATNRAMITLTDGRKVYLDEAGKGQLALQGNVKLVKLADGQIAYQTASSEVLKEIKYNTLTNPRGSKVIDMTLADGSRVWLNAGSSVTYPIANIGSERNVSITGEAYFEIAHDASKPFFVNKGDVQVQVLGTHFNVNAYDDESEIKVTLLEGSVAVNRESSVVRIKPGEQAQVGDIIKVVPGVDLEEVMAWKKGMFQFKDANIESIMKEVVRWYDVDVVYESKINQLFVAEIPRKVNASDFFRILEATGWVHFRIEGRKVIVMK